MAFVACVLADSNLRIVFVLEGFAARNCRCNAPIVKSEVDMNELEELEELERAATKRKCPKCQAKCVKGKIVKMYNCLKKCL